MSPTSNPPQLEISAPAEAVNVALIRKSVRRVLDDIAHSKDKVDDIMLALGEACNNAVLHSGSLPNQTICVKCLFVRNPSPKVTIDISNRGTALVDIINDSLFAMPSAELMGEHGRGLPLIYSLVDSVDVFANDNHTVVRMTKNL